MLPFTGDQITIEHPGTVEDVYGNVTPSFDNGATGYVTATLPAHVQPGRTTGSNSTESRGAGDRTQVITEIRVWIGAGPHACAQCRLTWHDQVWDVSGQPQEWSSPFLPGHIEIRAVRGSG
jgi:head-tail adaptor